MLSDPTLSSKYANKSQIRKQLTLLCKAMTYFTTRYLLIFLVRIGCIVAYFAPFIGLGGILDHYQAESIPLDLKLWQYLKNNTNEQYHYWNHITDEFESVHVSDIFRANDRNDGTPIIPSTTLYTLISLKTSAILFLVFFLLYGLLLALIKYCTNNDFNTATFGAKFQHIVEAINIPEAYGDWDTDHSLDLKGHLKKWKKVLVEMLVMVLFQLVTNVCLLLPLFITGMI